MVGRLRLPENAYRLLRQWRGILPDDARFDTDLEAAIARELFRVGVTYNMGTPAWADAVIAWLNAGRVPADVD